MNNLAQIMSLVRMLLKIYDWGQTKFTDSKGCRHSGVTMEWEDENSHQVFALKS